MPEFSGTIINFTRAATDQGGLLSGNDPTVVNLADPFRLWIIQVGIIVATASLLSLVLQKIHQPKVIAEVLGGILLGPTAFGRIPGFTQHIFPDDSRPFLTLTANVGLCLFLFLVGLEIDSGLIKRNAKFSVAIAFAGMSLPFGLGVALSKPLYHHFIPDSVQYTHFMLFTGVAYSITAFPVLCRILTELKLLDTTVGIVVLSAGVGNDIVGWTLLALSIALVNAGSGLMALYVLLACVGWTIFLLFPVKYALRWLAKRTGSIENGPTLFFMTITMMLMFGSAFFTDIIGVHAIFGAFITGLTVPREGGLTIALTEKLEDMVAIIFLPLYFTLSGLSTNLGLLNNGITWGFTIAIMSLAFTGKFGGCTLAAHYLARFNWRESATIGSLMSCKGLVELIVLNVGLSAGILNQRVFSMFVLEALVLTFMTTPLVTTLYPPKYRIRISKTGANFQSVADDVTSTTDAQNMEERKHRRRGKRASHSHNNLCEDEVEGEKTRFTVILDKIEHLSGAMAITQLLNPSIYRFEDVGNGNQDFHDNDRKGSSIDKISISDKPRVQVKEISGRHSLAPSLASFNSPSLISPSTVISPVINALRLIKLSDRVSAVMKSHETATLLRSDPILSIYRMFALLQGINISAELEVIPEEEMVGCTLDKAKGFGADMIMIPWVVHSSGNMHTVNGVDVPQTPKGGNVSYNPFDVLFRAAARSETVTQVPRGELGNLISGASVGHSHYIRSVFARTDIDVGLYIDQSDIIPSLHFDSDSSITGACSPADLMPVGLDKIGGGRGRVHIFFPFFGGPDDRFALQFVVGLCRKNEHIHATVVKFRKTEKSTDAGGTIDAGGITPGTEAREKDRAVENGNEHIDAINIASGTSGFPDTIYAQADTETKLVSATADDIIWTRYATPPSTTSRSSPEVALSRNIPRMSFKEIATAKPLHAALNEAYALQCRSDSRKLQRHHTQDTSTSTVPGIQVVVTGRSRRLAVESHHTELDELMQEDLSGGWEAPEGGVMKDIRKTVGDVGSVFVGRSVGVGVWILQASLDNGK